MEHVISIISLFNYGLVLLYGVCLSVYIVCEKLNRSAKISVVVLCVILLAFQIICWQFFGIEETERLYPLITHLPLLLALIFGMKKSVGIALVSICTAYLCCQLPRCGSVVVLFFTDSQLAAQITYTVLIFPIFFLLWRYFVPAARHAMTDSSRSLAFFGGLPVFYYFFDYATTIYSGVLYMKNSAIIEILPTVLIVFYVAFLTAYRSQMEKWTQTEMESSQLKTHLKLAEKEMTSLRQSERRAAIYQHDMRHHLNMLNGFLEADKPQQAKEYIKKVQSDIESLAHKRFCKNETVNLLCSSFAGKAERMGVQLTVNANLPEQLPIADTELCAMISNGLENALTAASKLLESDKWVKFSCVAELNRLLIEIKNPYTYTHGQESVFYDRIYGSTQDGHGYGCRSIRSIVHRHGGVCEFKGESGIFRLQIMLPLKGGIDEGM